MRVPEESLGLGLPGWSTGYRLNQLAKDLRESEQGSHFGGKRTQKSLFAPLCHGVILEPDTENTKFHIRFVKKHIFGKQNHKSCGTSRAAQIIGQSANLTRTREASGQITA
jgi:hypothetical protein